MRFNKLLLIGMVLILFSSFANAEIFFNDSFNRANSANVGNNWTETETGSGTAEILNNEVKLNIAGASDNFQLDHSYNVSSNQFYNLSFDLNATQTNVQLNIYTGPEGTKSIHIRFDSDGGLKYINSVPSVISTGVSYSANEYINYRLEINESSNTFDWYKNEVLICNDCDFRNTGVSDNFGIIGATGSASTYYLDNVSIYDETTIAASNFTINSNIDNFKIKIQENVNKTYYYNYQDGLTSSYYYFFNASDHVSGNITLTEENSVNGTTVFNFTSSCIVDGIIEIFTGQDFSGEEENIYCYEGVSSVFLGVGGVHENITNLTVQYFGEPEYETTTGVIITNILSNSTNLNNITISPNDFQLYERLIDVNVSSNLSYTFAVLNITAINAVTGSSINNFSINITYSAQSFENNTATTSGEIIHNLIGDYIYNITIDAPNYVINSTLENVSEGSSNLIFRLYETNSINITFKDEETRNIVDFENITLEIISDLFSNNYSTTNGTLFLSFITPEDYTMRYSSTSYDENFYYFELANRTTTELTLYMTNSSTSTQVTATVYDEASNLLEDAHIKVLRYNIDTNSYDQTQIVSTNFEGVAILNLVLNDEFYKFVIEYPAGTIKKTTDPTYIYTNTLEFQIQLGETIGETFFNTYGISSNLTFNGATHNFRWTYVDSLNTVTQGCLEVVKITPLGETAYNSSCSSSPSATILVGVLNETGVTYRADTFVYFNSDDTFIESLYKSFAATADTGDMGLFGTVILVIAFSFLGAVSPIAALLLAPLPIVFSAALGMIEISLSTALAIYALALIIAYIVRK